MYSVDRCEAILRRWGYTRVPGQSTESHRLYQGREREDLLPVRKFDDLTEVERIAELRDIANRIGEAFLADAN
jgi:hypothetical protein